MSPLPRIRIPRIRRKTETKPHPAEVHALSVFADEPEMQRKVRQIFRIFREREWKNVDRETAWKLIEKHILNSDAEELRRGIKYAEVLQDPRATLGQIMLFKAVGSEEHAKVLKELIDTAKRPDAHYLIGLKMFASQRVNRIPEVGMRSALEWIARWHNYKEEVLRKLKEIQNRSTWTKEIGAIKEMRVKSEDSMRELREKGASEGFAREIQEFIKTQEREQGKAGLGKDALIWERKRRT